AELAPAAPHGVRPPHEELDNGPFFRAGGRGEWRAIFTEAEHRRYHDRAAELAGADLLAWAHDGRRGCAP
ncbi:MAG: sulfotransferase domain-containing protein, partial [Mycobacterium sp.]